MEDITPLIELPALARAFDIARFWIKDEGCRRLGNFKSLGGLHAGSLAIERAGSDVVLLCASDGNHGLAVAAAAREWGAKARIYLPRTVDGTRVARIARLGAEIVEVDGTYDRAVALARNAAAAGKGILVPDTSSDPDHSVVADVVAGYRRLADEAMGQLDPDWPTHLFVQAGVGGLAAAIAQGMLGHRDAILIVVEPRSAACVGQALRVGHPTQFDGDLKTCADMLSCGMASAGAIATLLQYDWRAIAVDETVLARAPAILQVYGGPATTPSGAAGLAGVMAAMAGAQRDYLGLDVHSRILAFATEGPL